MAPNEQATIRIPSTASRLSTKWRPPDAASTRLNHATRSQKEYMKQVVVAIRLRGAEYRRMIEVSPAGRAGTPGEIATCRRSATGPDGGFITGNEFLMDGGVTAAY